MYLLLGVFQETLKHFTRLDIVVNNAGIMNDAVWEEEIHTNIVRTIDIHLTFKEVDINRTHFHSINL